MHRMPQLKAERLFWRCQEAIRPLYAGDWDGDSYWQVWYAKNCNEDDQWSVKKGNRCNSSEVHVCIIGAVELKKPLCIYQVQVVYASANGEMKLRIFNSIEREFVDLVYQGCLDMLQMCNVHESPQGVLGSNALIKPVAQFVRQLMERSTGNFQLKRVLNRQTKLKCLFTALG